VLCLTLSFLRCFKYDLTTDMTDYVARMVDESPFSIGSKAAPTPASENLFAQYNVISPLWEKQKTEFHTLVPKDLFLCQRARLEIHMTIATLCTRVQAPTDQDWEKLERLLKYLNGTRNERLVLKADSLNVLKWYVDASFATHPEFKSHTGAMMTFGSGAVQSLSRKQKLNTRSSTEAELVAAADASTLIFWMQQFLEAQGYAVERNILYQDNKATILLETNGRRS